MPSFQTLNYAAATKDCTPSRSMVSLPPSGHQQLAIECDITCTHRRAAAAVVAIEPSQRVRALFRVKENITKETRCIRGHPYMTSALRGEGGVSPKEDVVREVA